MVEFIAKQILKPSHYHTPLDFKRSEAKEKPPNKLLAEAIISL